MNNKDNIFSQESLLKPPQELTDVQIQEMIKSKAFNISDNFDEPEDILTVFDCRFGTLKNISVISGKAKAKKTFLVTLLMHYAITDSDHSPIKGLLGDRDKIVFIDTEQSPYYAHGVLRRIKRMSGKADKIQGYIFRGTDADLALKLTEPIIKKHAHESALFIIDGIRDMAKKGINDEETAIDIATKLLDWSMRYNIHIIVILHMNKGPDKTDPRGVLGTELQNKAETVVSVTQDKKERSVSIVEHDRAKDKAFETFAFMVNGDGLPEFCDVPVHEKDDRTKVRPDRINEDAHKEMITNIWTEYQDAFTTTELKPQIQFELAKKDWSVGGNIAGYFITYWIQKKWIKNKKKGNANQYSII